MKHWIVLEHADLLHADAQAFLRRIIETSVGGTRFIMEVRDLAAVAEPLLSRTVLFTGPSLLEHEVRGEILRRAPATSVARAAEIAQQANGNVRWAVLQAIGSGDSLLLNKPAERLTWPSLLAYMEDVQRSGCSPRHCLPGDPSPVWERPGGACPWSILALALAKRL